MEKKADRAFSQLKTHTAIEKLPRILFCVLMLFQLFLGRSHLGTIGPFPVLYGQFERHIGIVILLFCFAFKTFTKKELAVYLGVLFLLLVVTFYHHTPHNALLLLALTVLLKDESRTWIVNALFRIYLVAFSGVIGLYLLGVIGSYASQSRNSLGFMHPNTTGVVFLVLFICCLLQEKKWFWKVLLLGSYVVLNLFIRSTTPFLTMLLMLGLILLNEARKRLKLDFTYLRKNASLMMAFFLAFWLLISYYLAVIYTVDSEWLVSLNRFFTHRLRLSQIFVQDYSVNLFGNFLFSPGRYENGWRFLDNGYLWLLLAHGVVYTLTILSYFVWISKKMYQASFKYVPMIFIGIAVYTFSEHGIFTYWINVLLLFGGTFLKEDGIALEKAVILKEG